MRALWAVVTGAEILVLLCTAPVRVEASRPLSPIVVDWERHFTVDAQGAEARGRTVVQGTIRNTSDYTTRRIQLLVEGLNARGTVVSQRVEWLGGDLQPGAHLYFEIPARTPAASYRVSVFAFDHTRKS
ncbi:MAG: FxLYD domain-containing protein [Candidatus Rokuibacteriota bacterium]